MELQNDILNELKSWGSPLAGMSRAMPFVVPKGYFEALDTVVLNHIQADNNEWQLQATREMPYSVPAGYFEGLPEQVLRSIRQEGNISLPKAMPFEAPAGYFDQLPMEILQAVKKADKQPAKVIPLYSKVAKNIRWAAAAILLLGISIGSYKMLNPSLSVNAQDQLATVPQEEIGDYVQQHIDDFDGDMIENSVASANTMESVSDEDIINYLDETGWNTTTIN